MHICSGFYMITTKVDSVYDVAIPEDVKQMLARFSTFISFGLTGVATTPLECMNLSGYVPRLFFYTVAPAFAVIVIFIVNVMVRAWQRCRGVKLQL